MATIAFFGLGNMGGPMAANLLKAGHEVRVFDLVPELVAQLEQQGAIASATPEEAASGASFVISMLPAGKHVAGLFLGENGLLAKISTNTLVIDSSTIEAEVSRQVHDAAGSLGIRFLDAPVSGGVAAATAGTLSFMCGGRESTFESAREVLGAMGANLFHAGPEGAGQVAKMCNNMLLAIHMIGTSEALNLGEKNGVDPKVLSEIMLASSGKNWSLEKYNPFPDVMPGAPASNNYQPGFMVDLMAKDLGLAINNSEAAGCATPLGHLALELYSEKQSAGDGKRDFSSILELIRSKSRN